MLEGLVIDKTNELDLSEKALEAFYLNEIKDNPFVGEVKWPSSLMDHLKKTEHYRLIQEKLVQNNATYQRHPSDYLHGLMCQMTFNDEQFCQEYSGRVFEIGGDPGWTIEDYYCEPSDGEQRGLVFKSILFKNEAKRQLVLAHGEYELNLIKDTIKPAESSLSKSINGILCNQIVPQLICCYEITKKCVDMARNKYNLSFTGFSYGGWLAENSIYYAYKYFSYYNVKAVTFESSGLVKRVEDFASTIINSEIENDFSLHQLNIVNYLAAPNFLNTCNRHVGKVYRLFPASQARQMSDSATRKIKSILEKFLNLLSINTSFKINDFRFMLEGLIFTNKQELLGDMLKLFDKDTGLPVECELVENWPYMAFQPKGDFRDNIEKFLKKPTNILISYIPVPRMMSKPLAHLVEFLLPRLTSFLLDKFVPNLSLLLCLFIELASTNRTELLHFYDSNYYLKLDEKEKLENSDNSNALPGESEIIKDEFRAIFQAKYVTKRLSPYSAVVNSKRQDLVWFLKELYYLNGNARIAPDDQNFGNYFTEVQLDLLNRIKTSYEIVETLKGDLQLLKIEVKKGTNLTIDKLTELMIRLIYLSEFKLLKMLNSKVLNMSTINVYYSNGQEETCSIPNYLPEVELTNFIKRKDVFIKMFDTLNHELKWTVLQGFGGIGKTTVAREYAHLFLKNKSSQKLVVRWFNAESKKLIDKIYYDEFSHCLNLKPEKNQDQQIFINLVHGKMERLNDSYLFIFDNVKEYSVIEPYVKNLNTKQFQIIITTTDPKLFATNNRAQYIKIEPFSEDEAYTYINLSMADQQNRLAAESDRKYFYENLTKENASAGILPLKLKLAISIFKENYTWTLVDYMNTIDQKSNEETFSNLLLEPLKSTSASPGSSLSFHLVKFMAYLDGSFISLGILKELIANSKIKNLNNDKLDETLQSSIDILNKKSLVEIIYNSEGECGLAMHEMIQKIVRSNIDQKERRPFLSALSLTLAKVTPVISEIPDENWKRMEKFYPHIIKLLTHVYDTEFFEGAAKLYERLAFYYMYALNIQNESLSCAFKCLTVREKLNQASKNEDKILIASSLNIVACIYMNFSNYQKSLEYYSKVVDLTNVIKPLNILDLAKAQHNVGVVYSLLGNHQKALEYHKKALGLKQMFYNGPHPDLARSFNVLGVTYYKLRDPKQAIQYYKLSLEIRKNNLNQKESNYALQELIQSYNNLGIAFRSLAEHDTSLEFFLQALTTTQQIFPTDHPNTVFILENAAISRIDNGDLENGIKGLLDSLAILKQVYPKNHPEIAYVLECIGWAYHTMDELEKSMDYYLKALEVRKSLLGDGHADLADLFSNIALVYGKFGEHQMQLEYNIKALEIRSNIYPENHSDVAQSLYKIGNSYCLLDDFVKGLEYYSRALAVQRALSGPNQRDLADALYNVAVCQSKQDNYQDSLKNSLEALSLYRATQLTDDSKDVENCNFIIGTSYYFLGEWSEALEYCSKCLETKEKAESANSNEIAYLAFLLSNIANNLGDVDLFHKYSIMALELRESIQSESSYELIQLNLNAAVSFYSRNDFKTALVYFQKALEIHHNHEKSQSNPKLEVSILKQIAVCHQRLKEPTKMLDTLLKALEFKKPGSKEARVFDATLVELYSLISLAYEELNKKKKAAEYAKLAEEIAKLNSTNEEKANS